MLKHLKKIDFPTKVTLIYVSISCFWIIASDRLVLFLFFDPITQNKVSTYKGWGFVLTTGILFYLLIEKETKKRKSIEKELEFQAKKAKESDELKSQFLANMSHEIRTPLNGIIGFSQLLKNPNLNEEQKAKYLEIIDYSSDQLLMLINDILDISLIEADQMKIEKEFVDVNQMIDEIFELYNVYKNKKNKGHLDFYKTKWISNQNLMLYTDAKRLRQIFYNLLNNAFKFTYEGSIEFGYKFASQHEITFFVKDTGIGILETNQRLLFQRFRRMDSPTTFNDTGTGLGLAICKALTEKLNGEINVKSKIGIGSTFYFTLPIQQDDSTSNTNISQST